MTQVFPRISAAEKLYGPQQAYSEYVNSTKHRLPGETFEQAKWRVANALSDDDKHAKAFFDITYNMRFLEGGRIQRGAGSDHKVTLLNCLAGDTRILTKEFGSVEIASVANTTVTLLDGNCDWVPCFIYDHGEQETYAVKFSGGFEAVTIRSTMDHGWISPSKNKVYLTRSFSKKSRYEIGDIRPSKTIHNQESYRLGVIHGMMYGDGTYYEDNGTHHMRVCSNHESITPFLEGIHFTNPPSTNGDPVYYIPKAEAWANLKEFPSNPSGDVDYLLGFLRGWFAMDGCVSTQPEATICCDKEEMEWIEQWGPLVGWNVRGCSRLSDTTNFGKRNKVSLNVRIKPWSISTDDLLVSKHRERWFKDGEGSRKLGWRVAEGPHDFRIEQVYCPVVSTTHSFALACGIHSRNCYVMDVIHDSFAHGSGNGAANSIMDIAKQAAITMQQGGGVGYDFSTLRPSGDLIKGCMSVTDGPIAFMHIYDAICGATSSAGNRRGAQMGVMRIDHPDIRKFIRSKQVPEEARILWHYVKSLPDDDLMKPQLMMALQTTLKLTRFNISIGATDYFMECLYTGKPFPLTFNGKVYEWVDPNELWDEVMQSNWNSGEPGVVFIDKVNRMNNLKYCETIYSSNPCLDVNTLVSTDRGFIRLGDVNKNDSVQTVDGIRPITSIESHKQLPVYKVELSDGTTLRATAAHIFHVQVGKMFDVETRLDKLSIGDKIRLSPAAMPNNVIENSPFPELTDREYGTLVGIVLGDGCYTEKSRSVKIACDNREQDWIKIVNDLFSKVGYSSINKSTNEIDCVASREVMERLDKSPLRRGYSHEKSLPLDLLNSNREFLAGYIDGMISTDGNIHMSKSTPMIRVTSTNKEQLMMLKRALSCFGILGRVYPRVRQNGIINGREIESNHNSWVLCILGDGIRKIYKDVGISRPKRSERLRTLVLRYSLTGCTWNAEVKEITPDGVADVVDIYEEETDTWVTDGVVNRGCGEQFLPPHGSCLLGSHNLVQYVQGGSFDFEQLKRDIPVIARGMDNVNDVSRFPLDAQRQSAQNKRRMGSGVTGLADALAYLGLEYGSKEFVAFESKIMEVITLGYYQASVELAREKGAFPLFDADKYCDSEFIKSQLPAELIADIHRYGIRNSHLTSVAPTGSISMAADNVSPSIEPPFMIYGDRRIKTHDGEITVTVTDYAFREWGIKPKTASEVTAFEHVAVLNAAAEWCDASVSKTCNVPEDIFYEDFKQIYNMAWEGAAKGCTTFRDNCDRVGIMVKKDHEATEGGACYIDEMGRKSCE